MKVTADDIARLLGSRIPREVPPPVAATARRLRAPIGGAVAGALFLAVGLGFAAVFFPTRILDDWRLNGSGAATVTGRVTAVNRTNMKVNKQRVMRAEFTYAPADGPPRTGESFSSGALWKVGEQVLVRYLPDDPAIACIQGGRLNEAGWGGMFVAIFPALGGLLLVAFIAQRRSVAWLLAEGRVAELDIRSHEIPGMPAKNRAVHVVTLSAPTPDSGPVVVRLTNVAEVALITRCDAQKRPVFVLYNPRKPTQLIFPEALIETRSGGLPQNG